MEGLRLFFLRIRNSRLQSTFVIAVCLFIIWYFFTPWLMLPKNPSKITYTYEKSPLPHEAEEVDPADCKAKNIKELMKGPMNQVDKRLLSTVRKYYLIPPSELPYNLLEGKEGVPEEGMSDIVIELLSHKRDGFFIESRVKLVDRSTGQFDSNTLYLEKHLGWSGVIVEPEEEIFNLLKTKNRKAYIVPAILSPNMYPQVVGFFPELENGVKQDDVLKMQAGDGSVNMKVKIVQAFPIVTILAAMRTRSIDYLSLCAQGREFEILNTIPYEKVHINIITVDHEHNFAVFQSIKTLLEAHGFIFVSSIIRSKFETSIYAHPSLFE